MSRIAQANTALAKLKQLWTSHAISVKTKMKLMKSLVQSIFLYGSETWTITKYLEKRIESFENKCYRKILNISFRDRVSNVELDEKIVETLGEREKLMDIIKKRKLRWYGHVTRGDGLTKAILQGKVQGKRKQGRPGKVWMDNVKEWTPPNYRKLQGTETNGSI